MPISIVWTGESVRIALWTSETCRVANDPKHDHLSKDEKCIVHSHLQSVGVYVSFSLQ